jgi:hypothetical protein
MNIHAKGNKLKLLFLSLKGNASMQDLFDLPTNELRRIANKLNSGLKKSDNLFAVVSTCDTDNKLRLDIILDVLENRELEVSAKITSEEKSQKLKKVRERIASKKEEAECDLSIEELEAMEKTLIAE